MHISNALADSSPLVKNHARYSIWQVGKSSERNGTSLVVLTIFLQAVVLSLIDSERFRAKLNSALWDQSPAGSLSPKKAKRPIVPLTGGEALVTCRK